MLIWISSRAFLHPLLLVLGHWLIWLVASLALWRISDEETVPSLVMHAVVLVFWFFTAWSLAATLQGRSERAWWLPRTVMFLASLIAMAVSLVHLGSIHAFGMMLDPGVGLPYLKAPMHAVNMLLNTGAGKLALACTVAAACLLGLLHAFWHGLGRSVVSLAGAAIDQEERRHRLAGLFPAGLTVLSGAALATIVHWAGPDSRLIREPFIAAVTPAVWSSVPGRDVATAAEAVAISLRDLRELQAWQPSASARPRDIVLIVSDALRADRMAVYGYGRPTTPFLSGLQESGGLQRVDFAFAPCPETICGVAALLASQGATRAVLRPTTLPILLDRAGYRVNFVLSSFTTSYYDLRTLIREAPSNFMADGEDCPDLPPSDDNCVLRHIQRMPRPDDRPSFTFVLLTSTHEGGYKMPEFQVFDPDPRMGGEAGARYDGGVLQADSFIKRLLADLESTGQTRSPLVMITADHGDGMGEHGSWSHGRTVHPEMVHVPLLLWDPRGETRLASTRFSLHADVAPTLLDAVGLEAPPRFEGVSLLRPPAPGGRFTRLATFQGRNECDGIAGVEEGHVALAMRCPREEVLYLMSEDPLGLRNLRTDPRQDGEGRAVLEGAQRRLEALPRR